MVPPPPGGQLRGVTADDRNRLLALVRVLEGWIRKSLSLEGRRHDKQSDETGTVEDEAARGAVRANRILLRSFWQRLAGQTHPVEPLLFLPFQVPEAMERVVALTVGSRINNAGGSRQFLRLCLFFIVCADFTAFCIFLRLYECVIVETP